MNKTNKLSQKRTQTVGVFQSPVRQNKKQETDTTTFVTTILTTTHFSQK